jgi:hypothetical protein
VACVSFGGGLVPSLFRGRPFRLEECVPSDDIVQLDGA